MTRKSIQGGYCNWPDQGGCALTKLDCDDPANFLSSRQMQDGPVRAHGGSCRWQDSIRSMVLGKCGASNEQCASTLAACPSEDRIEWKGPDSNSNCTVETTLFGRCDYGMCAWSHDHCHEDNTWEAFDPGCTCDQVQVGACSRWNEGGEREVFCAVSELACDNEQSWIPPQEVNTAAGFDCFLCRKVSEAPADMPSTEEDTTMLEMGTNNSRTIIVISASLGFAIASLIIGLVVWRVFKTRRAVKRAIDGGLNEEQAPPTIAIEINLDENYDETDTASVLSLE